MAFHNLEEIVQDLKEGRMVVMVDDEHRENEGDVIFAADFVTPEKINFLVKEARGLICLALGPEQVDRLKLPLMVPDSINGSPNKTAFTISIEACTGVSTGISVHDRAHTIRVASRPGAQPGDISSPGHVFPLRARAGGVLERAGHTEASVDLMRLAGLNPAAVICEVMNDDGTMAQVGDLLRFSERYQLKMGKIHDLIVYLSQGKPMPQRDCDQSL